MVKKLDRVVFANPLIFDTEDADTKEIDTTSYSDNSGDRSPRSPYGSQAEQGFAKKSLFSHVSAFEESVDVGNSPRQGTPSHTACCGLLHPDTRNRSLYDLLHTVALSWILVSLPVWIALSKTSDTFGVYFWLDVSIDFLFIFDLVLNFFAYYVQHEDQSHSGEMITDRRMIRKRYMRTWFVVDFVSVLGLPIDLIMRSFFSVDETMAVRGSKLLRLFRLLRVLRFANFAGTAPHLVQAVQKKLGLSASVLQLTAKYVTVFFLTVVIGHFCACMALSLAQEEENSGQGSWLNYYYANYEHQDYHRKEFQVTQNRSWTTMQLPDSYKYIDSVYFVLVIMVMVGFGDLSPKTIPEKIAAVIYMFICALFNAYVIGTVSEIIASNRQASQAHVDKTRTISLYLDFLEVPKDLKRRVLDVYAYKLKKQDASEEHVIMRELPQRLRTDLLIHRYGKIIRMVPFFHGVDNGAIGDCLMCLKHFCASAGDKVSDMAHASRELFIVTAGAVREVGAGGITFEAGSFFGEQQFLGMYGSHTATTIAITYSEVSSLRMNDMRGVLNDNKFLRQCVFLPKLCLLLASSPHKAGREAI